MRRLRDVEGWHMSKEAEAVYTTIPTDRQHECGSLTSPERQMLPLCCRPASSTYLVPPTGLKGQHLDVIVQGTEKQSIAKQPDVNSVPLPEANGSVAT
jgi:hypothetical protein